MALLLLVDLSPPQIFCALTAVGFFHGQSTRTYFHGVARKKEESSTLTSCTFLDDLPEPGIDQHFTSLLIARFRR